MKRPSTDHLHQTIFFTPQGPEDIMAETEFSEDSKACRLAGSHVIQLFKLKIIT